MTASNKPPKRGGKRESTLAAQRRDSLVDRYRSYLILMKEYGFTWTEIQDISIYEWDILTSAHTRLAKESENKSPRVS